MFSPKDDQICIIKTAQRTLTINKTFRLKCFLHFFIIQFFSQDTHSYDNLLLKKM